MNKMMKNFRKRRFTLVELIVSMAVFALLSMVVVQLFSATQKLWVSNSQKSELSAEGRMALDFISNLLMSSTINPEDANGNKWGSDYFVLAQKGDSVDATNTSQLYFVTKSDLPALVGDSTEVSSCFVGIQVAKITRDSDDPDYKCCVLVASALTSESSKFEARFPDNTTDKNIVDNGDVKDITTLLDDEKTSSFATIVSNSTHKVSRIATNVVDFQVRAFDTCSHIQNGGGRQVVTADDDKPEAVEIELTLMDRQHYKDYIENTADRERLRNQYGRTFRRIVWLNGMNRADVF